jgi:hypothetical protein
MCRYTVAMMTFKSNLKAQTQTAMAIASQIVCGLCCNAVNLAAVLGVHAYWAWSFSERCLTVLHCCRLQAEQNASLAIIAQETLEAAVDAHQHKWRVDSDQRVEAILACRAGAFLSGSLAWESATVELPPRCSHWMGTFTIGTKEVTVLIGGMANSEWQPLVLVMSAIQNVRLQLNVSEPQVDVADVKLIAPLQYKEPAVCKTGPATCMLVGSDEQDATLSLWTGSLCQHDTGSACGIDRFIDLLGLA